MRPGTFGEEVVVVGPDIADLQRFGVPLRHDAYKMQDVPKPLFRTWAPCWAVELLRDWPWKDAGHSFENEYRSLLRRVFERAVQLEVKMPGHGANFAQAACTVGRLRDIEGLESFLEAECSTIP